MSADPARPWPPPGRTPCASACEPQRDLIVAALGRGRNAMAIWPDLRTGRGYPHPWHDEAPGGSDVCREAARPAAPPVEPLRYYRFGERTVHLAGCVEVEAAYYSAPPGRIAQRVHVQWTDVTSIALPIVRRLLLEGGATRHGRLP